MACNSCGTPYDPIEAINPLQAWRQRQQTKQGQAQQAQRGQQLQALIAKRTELIWYINSFKTQLDQTPPTDPTYSWYKNNYDHNVRAYQDLTRQIVALGGQ